MGGPMGVYEEKEYPLLKEEKVMIREAFKDNIPILGICLGSQLIANALGAKVYPYKQEIGWYDVRRVNADDVSRDLPERMMTFQWHNDTFDLPENAKQLYEGNNVRNQAFRIGNAIALQFHLEVTPEIINKWIESEESLSEERKWKILNETPVYIEELNENCRKLLNSFLKIR
jgi:GMP synthase-like glutamine amidotransferase